MATFADLIKLMQDRFGMSLEATARFFDVSYMALHSWKSGKAKPSQLSIWKVTEKLKAINCEDGIEIIRRLDE